MPDDIESLLKRQKELEMELEETRNLSQARSKLLVANINELHEVYIALNEKIKDLRRKDARIKGFEAELFRMNKLSSLGEMAFSIAHEIKNPLIAIEGFAKRIEKSTDPEDADRHARLIEAEAERLSNVLAKLLEFARKDGPKKERVTPYEIVDDTVLFMEHHLTRFKHVELTVEKEEGLPPLSVDKIHIQQALINIIMNAAQAMSKGGLITIRTALRDTEVAISVSDQGGGIREEDVGSIFESFFTTKAKGEGTGLGLPLTKRLVEANGGRIELDNRPGDGCTFTFLLPIDREAAAGEGAESPGG
jgi:C4-dicarboxylate-specific signal transduction histidine kinase